MWTPQESGPKHFDEVQATCHVTGALFGATYTSNSTASNSLLFPNSLFHMNENKIKNAYDNKWSQRHLSWGTLIFLGLGCPVHNSCFFPLQWTLRWPWDRRAGRYSHRQGWDRAEGEFKGWGFSEMEQTRPLTPFGCWQGNQPHNHFSDEPRATLCLLGGCRVVWQNNLPKKIIFFHLNLRRSH